MKFHITLNVPTKNQMSHQIIVAHEANTLREFKKVLQSEDFTLVEEWQPEESGAIVSQGELLINNMNVAKVRIFKMRQRK